MQRWKVIAYKGKRGEIRLGESYVRAESEEHAREVGRQAFKVRGMRGKFFVHAMAYDPAQDRELIAYRIVQKVSETNELN